MPPSTMFIPTPPDASSKHPIFARLPAYNPFVGTFHHAPSAGNRGAVYFSGDIVCVEELEERKKLRQNPLTGTFHALPGYYDPLHGLEQFRNELNEQLEEELQQKEAAYGRSSEPLLRDPPLSIRIKTIEVPRERTKSSITIEPEEAFVLTRRSSEPIRLEPKVVSKKNKPKTGFVPIRARKLNKSVSYSPYAVCSPRHSPKDADIALQFAEDDVEMELRPLDLNELRSRPKRVIDENQGFISTGKGVFQLTGCPATDPPRSNRSTSSSTTSTTSSSSKRLVTSPIDPFLLENDEDPECTKEYNQSAPRIPVNPFIARRLRDDDQLRVMALDRVGCRGLDDTRLGSSSDEEEAFEHLPKPYFIHENAVTEHYEVLGEDQLGDGSYAVVRPAVRKDNGTEVAIKQVHKRYLRTAELKKAVNREVEIHLRLRHRHIVRLYEVYETDDFLYLVMEKATRGTLKQLLTRKRCLPEPMAQKLAHQLVRSVYHMHEHGVLHCDLKPDNVLLTDPLKAPSGFGSPPVSELSPLDINPADPHADMRACDVDVQLCDFGLAMKVPDVRYYKHTGDVHKVPFNGVTGTPGYIAPELMRHEPYGISADMWSVGVVIFEMLMGYQPYYLPQECLSEDVDFSDRMWAKISPEAKDLVQHLLTRDPTKRFTAEQTLSHVWFEVSPFQNY